MQNLLSHWSLSLLIFVFAGCTEPQEKKIIPQQTKLPEISVDTFSILSEKKIELSKLYCEKYYGLDDIRLKNPDMVVIHFTAIPTLESTLNLFKKDELSSNRSYIGSYSKLNVSIHYVIDKNGDIYSLLPDTLIARHIIGYNHVSIGIENIALDESELTASQLESNTKLVNFLKARYPSINYLIGHDEYNIDSLEHTKFYKSLDTTYAPYDKPDPGQKFMQDLRHHLDSIYGLEFRK